MNFQGKVHGTPVASSEKSSDEILIQRFFINQKAPLEKFFFTKPELASIKKVFYPFGGSDVLYPLSVFPHVQEIILVALENVFFNSDEDLHDSFKETPLCDDVVSLLTRSFSVSKNMWDNEKKYREGVFARICDQLRILGVKDMHPVYNSAQNILTVSFTYRDVPRKIIYRQTSLTNRKNLPEILEWLEKQNIDGVLMKATSFCMHQKNFSQIRDFVKKNAKVIVQDDTGIPLKQLEETHVVKKFGIYTRPYGAEWTPYIQPDLREKKAEEDGSLEFFFGYGARAQPCVVLIAFAREKKEENTEPQKNDLNSPLQDDSPLKKDSPLEENDS